MSLGITDFELLINIFYSAAANVHTLQQLQMQNSTISLHDERFDVSWLLLLIKFFSFFKVDALVVYSTNFLLRREQNEQRTNCETTTGLRLSQIVLARFSHIYNHGIFISAKIYFSIIEILSLDCITFPSWSSELSLSKKDCIF